jgi:hypothetical protein
MPSKNNSPPKRTTPPKKTIFKQSPQSKKSSSKKKSSNSSSVKRSSVSSANASSVVSPETILNRKKDMVKQKKFFLDEDDDQNANQTSASAEKQKSRKNKTKSSASNIDLNANAPLAWSHIPDFFDKVDQMELKSTSPKKLNKPLFSPNKKIITNTNFAPLADALKQQEKRNKKAYAEYENALLMEGEENSCCVCLFVCLLIFFSHVCLINF